MTAAQLRERLTSRFLREIEESKYPSVSMLNRVEASLGDREALAGYVEVLAKKVEETPFPSAAMLNRLEGLIARLEQLERREQAQSASEDSST